MRKYWKKCLVLTLSLFLLLETPARFLKTVQSFGAQRLANTAASGTYSSDGDFEAYMNAQGFPESYRPALRELHIKYPQWIFTAVDTGLDWEEVIRNESLVGRNLVSSTSISSWKSTADGAYNWESGTWPGFDGSSWVAASEGIIRYYMDPRNFIDETYIFQFLSQSYDPSVHTREGLTALVNGTFLAGTAYTGGAYTGLAGDGTLGTSSAITGGNPSGTTGGKPSGITGGSPSDTAGEKPSGTTGGNPSGTSGGNSSSGRENYGPGFESAPPSTSSGNSGVVVGVPPGAAEGISSAGASSGTGYYSSTNTAGSTNTSGGTDTAGSTNVSSSTDTSGSINGEKPSAPLPANVQIGVAPGMNISRAAPELSRSLRSISRVSAPVGQTGPGSEGSISATGGTAGMASYVDILMEAGAKSGVNPYVLAAMILQEQGSQGRSESISGTSGYYNFFNFEAYASNGMTAVQRGLWYASQSGDYMRPWNSPDKSIIGGACQYGQNYVQAGQDTFYLKKFNVQGSNLYKHQYMTNIEGAAAEGARMGQAYSESMRQTALQFMIPVYRDMPLENSPMPMLDGSPNNKLSGISADGFALTPSFSRDTLSYEIFVDSTVSSVTLHAAAIDSAAQINGTGTVSLTQPVTEAAITVTAQNGTVRTYTLRITKNDGSQSGDQNNPGGGNVTIIN